MIPLRLVVHHARLDALAQASIRARAERLGHYADHILECRLTIDRPNRRRRVDRTAYGVRLVLDVPRGRIAIARQPRRTLETALDEAFQAARRRLQDHARRLRGAVKAPSIPVGRTGT